MELVDHYNRRIDYLRLSVTHRCNLKCVYCNSGGAQVPAGSRLLTFEEITSAVTAFLEAGGRKVRLTGGEPLLRPGIAELAATLAALPGLDDLSLTTNGVLLKDMALDLRRAGVDRVNISLDTLKPYCFTRITRSSAALGDVLNGIRAAGEAGFHPVKINVVVMKGLNDDEIQDFVDFAMSENVTIRFIEYMPIGDSSKWKQYYVPAESILNNMSDSLASGMAEPLPGRGPAKYYTLKSGGQVGIISPVSHGFCGRCNRLRLTSDGTLISCLLSNSGLSLREIPGGMKNAAALKKAFHAAVNMKGRHGDFKKASRGMRQVGG